MMRPLPTPDDWTCPVCAAGHATPALNCRRCGTPLVHFARIAVAARLLSRAGCHHQAMALRSATGAYTTDP